MLLSLFLAILITKFQHDDSYQDASDHESEAGSTTHHSNLSGILSRIAAGSYLEGFLSSISPPPDPGAGISPQNMEKSASGTDISKAESKADVPPTPTAEVSWDITPAQVGPPMQACKPSYCPSTMSSLDHQSPRGSPLYIRNNACNSAGQDNFEKSQKLNAFGLKVQRRLANNNEVAPLDSFVSGEDGCHAAVRQISKWLVMLGLTEYVTNPQVWLQTDDEQ
jgi:hypothetical protein